VLSLFKEISCNIDIDSSLEYDVPKNGEGRPDKGCWALSKSGLRKLVKVRPVNNLDGEVEDLYEPNLHR
jgi:hypothetical protein